MARWFTSDLHFGHANIIRFCSRPFWVDGILEGAPVRVPDPDAMNAALCRAINTAVGPEDELWVLGDVAMGRLDETLPLIRSLAAGRKVLVAGNHDRCHPSNGSRAQRFLDLYSDRERSGFDEVILTNTSLLLTDGTQVQTSHFPYALSPQESRARQGATEATDRFAEWRPADTGDWLLCGHVHDAWRQQGRQINVGIDAWGGRPVSETDLVALIAEGPADRDCLAWPALR
jgi:calcineurin-like phosphoesterase family protein